MRLALRHRAVLAWACVALGAAGCQFNPPSSDGTSFTCTETPRCPAGFTCVAGVCVAGAVDAAADAPVTAVDGPVRPADAAPIDARVGPITLTFGERSIANVTGVAIDATIYIQPPQPLPALTEMRVTGSVANEAASLMRFDLRMIPAGSTVRSAELLVYVLDPFRPRDPNNGEVASAQVLTVPWDEATATWSNAATGRPWPTAGAKGASVGATIVASFIPEVDMDYTVPLAVAPVQAWVDDPASNFGMRWRAAGGNNNILRMRTREHGEVAFRPMLRVTFDPP